MGTLWREWPGGIEHCFSKCRVLIIGDVMLDEYVWGDAHRICPEAPVPVVEERGRSVIAGGAGNVACNIAAAGAEARLGGVVGMDIQANMLRELLLHSKVDCSGVMGDPGRPTTTKLRVIAHGQQIVRVDKELREPVSNEIRISLWSWFADRAIDADACVLSDYAKGALGAELVQRIIVEARARRLPVIVDPKGCDYVKYRGATIITPNLSEAKAAVAGRAAPNAHLAELGSALLQMLPETIVMITCGAEGLAIFRNGHPTLTIPSVARQVYDVTGAGDTLLGILAVATGSGMPIEVAAELANTAAGIAVGKVGTSTVSAQEILASRA